MTLRPSVRPIALAAALAVAACSAATPTPAPSTAPPPGPTASPSPATGASVLPGGTFGELTFFDEFDGPAIDTTRWAVEVGHQNDWPDTEPWRRNYKKENVYIKDGALVIRAAEEEVGYSTGVVGTGDKGQAEPFEQAFGRFETRMRLPTQPGHGGAFWLWNVSQGYIDGSGRDGSEIDIFERIWTNDQCDHAIHWDGYGAEHQSAVQWVTGMGLTDGGWHVFRLDWYPDQYVFFIDGKETWRTSAGGVSQAPNFVILSDEIISWGTAPIETAVLPDYTYYDYVRVYAYVPPR